MGSNLLSKSVSSIEPTQVWNELDAGLSIIDRHFKILWVNRCQERHFGASRDICGKYCYKIIEGKETRCIDCPAWKTFKTGQAHHAIMPIREKDGLTHYYQFETLPIKDANGNVDKVMELIEDVDQEANGSYLELKEELEYLHKSSQALATNLGLSKIIEVITSLICKSLHVSSCVFWIYNAQKSKLNLEALFGAKPAEFVKTSLAKGEGISGDCLQKLNAVAVSDLAKSKFNGGCEVHPDAEYSSCLALPVIFSNKPLGVVAIFDKQKKVFSCAEKKVLNAFCAHAATAIYEDKLYNDVHINYFNTVHALALAMEARDPYMRGHSERVTQYAIEIARVLGLTREELQVLRYAGQVHDVGKIGIPDSILNKPGRLTRAERSIIELHPIKGAEMLEPLQFLEQGLPVVRYHHERYDGKGYPEGLRKETIPFMARILTCADSFDAMTSLRPYKSTRMSVAAAIKEMRSNAAIHFDPRVVETFVGILEER